MVARITVVISTLVDISGDPVLDTVLFACIGFVSYAFSFGLVGRIFDALGHYDSDLMSGAHLLIRVFTFAFLTWGLVKLFQFVSWISSFQCWVYLIVLLIVIIIVLTIFTVIHMLRKNEGIDRPYETHGNGNKKVSVHSHGSTGTVRSDSIHNCPRCKSELVNRHGPYGSFIGCSSYPQCRYTRSRF